MNLNERAWQRAAAAVSHAEEFGIENSTLPCGTRVVDCGVRARGGLAAGVLLGELCLADLGRVSLQPGDRSLWPGALVAVQTDHPLAACMASQYAGWQITGEKFFAMGSGPMRAAAAKEELFKQIGFRETPAHVVGVLESSKLPTDEVAQKIASDCRVAASELLLLVARTASLAGTLQVVARTVETTLHKMHELGFDLTKVVSGFGTAPLPPVAKDDMAGIGRTNDAVLYGGEVTLWVRAEDAELQQLGPKIPSSASEMHGQPFAEIFAASGYDFYKIDPNLFSPAVVNLMNLSTGRTHRYGEFAPEVLRKSFES